MDFMPIDDLIAMIDEAQGCTFCGMHSFSQSEGDPCNCCGKILLGRQLRPSTCDPSRTSYCDPNDDGVVSPLKPLANVGDDRNPSFAIRKPTFKRSKAKMKTALKTTCGKQADDVLAEFEALLVRDGFNVGGGSDGTARKYARYMKMLFDHGVFKCRSDFFLPDSREKAHKFYREFAFTKASENGGKTSASKLFGNFKNGFDKFVMLVHIATVFNPLEPTECDEASTFPEADDLDQDQLLAELLSLLA